MSHSFFGQYGLDDREVSFEFQLPFINDGAKYAYSAPRLHFWNALTICLGLQTMIGSVGMCLAWVLIKKNRETNPTAANLACYGFLCPLSLYLPFVVLPYLNISNATCSTPFVAMAFTNVLHFMEVLYDTSPPFAEKNLSNFLMYHTSPVMLRFHPKSQDAIKVTSEEIRQKLKTAFISLLATVFFVNLLLSTSFEPFGKRPLDSFTDYFDWRHLGNNMANAYLAGTNVETGTLIFGSLISFATGYSTITLNDSPFSKSTSVADFWGRRWNIQFGGLLKNSVFKSSRKNGISRYTAVLLTFVMSSIFHEYVIYATSTAVINPNRPTHTYVMGRQSAFFMWNGMMMILEGLLMQNKVIKAAWETKLPQPVRTFIIIMTSLPISRWFMDDYIGVHMFDDFSVAFPKIRAV